MIKPERIWEPSDLTINQLYMFLKYKGGTMERGYCKSITENNAEFDTGSHYNATICLNKNDRWNNEKIYVYNASIFNKYNKLLEQQEKEREDLLLGKEVIIQDIANKKWYDRFLKRNKNNE